MGDTSDIYFAISPDELKSLVAAEEMYALLGRKGDTISFQTVQEIMDAIREQLQQVLKAVGQRPLMRNKEEEAKMSE